MPTPYLSTSSWLCSFTHASASSVVIPLIPGALFSPTGGTKRVADMLAETILGEQSELDLTMQKKLLRCGYSGRGSDDPCHAGIGRRAPVLVMERFHKLHGNGGKCILAAVYGNRDFEDTLVEMQDAAGGGFHVIGAVVAIAEHSVVREDTAGRPDDANRQELHRAARQFLRAAENPAARAPIPGNRPYTKPMSLSLIPKRQVLCTGCGAKEGLLEEKKIGVYL